MSDNTQFDPHELHIIDNQICDHLINSADEILLPRKQKLEHIGWLAEIVCKCRGIVPHTNAEMSKISASYRVNSICRRLYSDRLHLRGGDAEAVYWALQRIYGNEYILEMSDIDLIKAVSVSACVHLML